MLSIQKYFENIVFFKKILKVKNENNTNIYLYCNYYSFYSQKVLMALYEKNIIFEPIMIDITKGEQYSSWFLNLNPRGEIPVLKVSDQIIPDSTRILDFIEYYLHSDYTPLIEVSSDPKILSNINKFRDLFEAIPAGIITIGSFFHSNLCGRPKLPFVMPVREVLKNGDLSSSKNLKKLAKENPNASHILLYKAEIQDRKHEILTSEEEYLKILNIVDDVLTQVEEQLKHQSEDSWLCCDNFTVADINLTVLLQRLWELGFEDRFWAAGKRPHLERYFYRVKQRNSFKKTMPNFLFHCKMIIMSQPASYVAGAGIVSISVVFVTVYFFKKILC